MKWILWIVTAVPVITAGAVLHFKLKESVGGKWNILPKCLATWMIFCTALAGVLQRGNAADAGWIAAALDCFWRRMRCWSCSFLREWRCLRWGICC